MIGSGNSLVYEPEAKLIESQLFLTSMDPKRIGLMSVVIPTPTAQPLTPKAFPCARISLGKISVGSKKATVPQVDAYIRLNMNSMATAAGAKADARDWSPRVTS